MAMIFRGKVWKFGDNISTDLMMPGMAAFHAPEEEWAKYCMHANRPGWAEEVSQGDILVAGSNLGCGSSRSVAGILRDVGISCAVAESVSRLFLRNAINVGFPVLICPGITALAREGDELEVNVDTGTVCNLADGKTIEAEGFPEDSPPAQILRAGGLEPFLRQMLSRSSSAGQAHE
jgi:3-isopropylmalate/(R)-2-methylmalate dehydratase small subunit